MKINELIGKTVTNIFSLVEVNDYGLDIGECFIELDNNFIIEIPFEYTEDIRIKKLNRKAVSVFKNLKDIPFYLVNKDKKSISELTEKYQKQRQSIFNRILRFLFGYEPVLKDYVPYKTEYKENKLKHIKGRKITDILWYDDESEKSYFLLDNGYLITETTVSPYGLGLAGLNYYESLNDLENEKGNEYFKITGSKGFC
jgi:hypothetical protein